MKWQTMDSAPRDGTEFLAFDPVVKMFDVCVMRSTMVGGNVQWWSCDPTQYDGENGSLSDEFNGERATLWAPLPELDEKGMPT